MHRWNLHNGVLLSSIAHHNPCFLGGKLVERLSFLADFAKKLGDCVRLYKMDLVSHRRLDVVFDDNHSMPSEGSAACCITQDRLLCVPHAVHGMTGGKCHSWPWDSKTQNVMHVMSLMQLQVRV